MCWEWLHFSKFLKEEGRCLFRRMGYEGYTGLRSVKRSYRLQKVTGYEGYTRLRSFKGVTGYEGYTRLRSVKRSYKLQKVTGYRRLQVTRVTGYEGYGLRRVNRVTVSSQHIIRNSSFVIRNSSFLIIFNTKKIKQ